MARIKKVRAREILDSRGHPTVEVDVLLDSGVMGRASVPSGASTGSKEAVELRDSEEWRFHGKGVARAVANVNKHIAPRLAGMDPEDQGQVDQAMIELDGTANKSRLGANAILGVSLATAKAAATESHLPLYRYLGGTRARVLPVPLMNILNGGAHADNNLDFQEFMVVPIGKTFRDSLRIGSEVFQSLKQDLKKKGLGHAVGDEGGFSPRIGSHEQAIELVVDAVEAAGLSPGKDVFIALDSAASEFFEDDRYVFRKGSLAELSPDDMVDLYDDFADRYPILSYEDPMAEDDWAGWKGVTSRLGKRVQLVGDDVFVTNEKVLSEGIQQGIANAVLIKVNQVGTLTETMRTVRLAQRSGYTCVVSHRSGETEDTSISHLAVATNAGQIKTGAPSRGERTAKYNELLRIEEELGSKAKFLGKAAFKVRPG
jgi:enolase